MVKKLTEEQISTTITNCVNTIGDELIDIHYNGSKSFARIKCTHCNESYTKNYECLKLGRGCIKCSFKRRGDNRRHTYEYVCMYFHMNGGYLLMSEEYINNSEKLLVVCPENHEFQIAFDKFVAGERCSRCAAIKRGFNNRLTYQYVHEFICNNGDILLSDTYVNTCEKLHFKCSKNHEFQMAFRDYHTGNRCPKCGRIAVANKLQHKPEAVAKYMQNRGDQLVGKYHNARTKVQIKCGKCNLIFDATLMSYQKSRGCISCNTMPIGESIIKKYLDDHNIDYVLQKSFDGCVLKKPLRFDFYIPQYDTCIEYDGQQHFQSIKFFGGDEQFELVKTRDKIKTEYCDSNNITLLRIAYTEKNIYDILDKSFIK